MISEIDLNHCRQVKDKWGFQMTQRLGEYADELKAAAAPGFRPQVIVDMGVDVSAGPMLHSQGMLHSEVPAQLAAPAPPQLSFAGRSVVKEHEE